MKLILTIALASTQATIHRGKNHQIYFNSYDMNSYKLFYEENFFEIFFKAPRQAEDYDGDFPSTITARRSMFDMPRYKQG